MSVRVVEGGKIGGGGVKRGTDEGEGKWVGVG